ncbi:MAG: helix-turn-helix domain-containing protein [Brevundimonas sp.]
MLHTTHHPVSTVALDAGFNDLSTFHRRFHKRLGITPTGYRRARL